MPPITISLRFTTPAKKLAQLGKSWVAEFRAAFRESEATAKVRAGRLFKTDRRLSASIHQDVRSSGAFHVGALTADAAQAAVLEYGGTIPPRTVRAGPGRVLRFTINGTPVFAQYANIPAVTIPPRPFLRPSGRAALREFRRTLVRDLIAAGVE